MKFIPTLTHRQEDEFKLEFSREHVLSLIHDTVAFFRMNPSVLNLEREGPGSEFWSVTDRVETPFGQSSTTYRAQMTPTPSGFVAKSWAALGVQTTSSWAVVELPASQDGASFHPQCLVQISGTIEAPFPIFSFVKAQSSKIHQDTEARIRKTVAERIAESGPSELNS